MALFMGSPSSLENIATCRVRVALRGFVGLSSTFPRRHARILRAYDEPVKQIPCVCGMVLTGENDDELWHKAQAHLREDHPELAGKVSRADLLAQAEEIPRPAS
jgi:hypothetical protein